MTVIKRTALVPYTPRQMFELVNDVKEYPRFLQWCHESKIIRQDEKEVEAALEIAWSGFHKSFTTLNILTPYSRIDIKLVEGPLQQLEGHWEFVAVGDQGSRVNLNLEFEVGKSFFDRLLEPVFNHIANSLVDAFCKRAVEIYGSKDDSH